MVDKVALEQDSSPSISAFPRQHYSANVPYSAPCTIYCYEKDKRSLGTFQNATLLGEIGIEKNTVRSERFRPQISPMMLVMR